MKPNVSNLLAEQEIRQRAERSLLEAVAVEIEHFEQLVELARDPDDLILKLDRNQIAIGRPFRGLCVRFKPKNHCNPECPLFTVAFANCCREFSKIRRVIQLYMVAAASGPDIQLAIADFLHKLVLIKKAIEDQNK